MAFVEHALTGPSLGITLIIFCLHVMVKFLVFYLKSCLGKQFQVELNPYTQYSIMFSNPSHLD